MTGTLQKAALQPQFTSAIVFVVSAILDHAKIDPVDHPTPLEVLAERLPKSMYIRHHAVCTQAQKGSFAALDAPIVRQVTSSS